MTFEMQLRKSSPRLNFILIVASIALALSACASAFGQQPNSPEHWSAYWISHPTAPLREPGVFHFRKIIQVSAVPERYLVHVSADNRFVLYVNGMRVGEGPGRGDMLHWRYESFDLASLMHPGKNVVAAVVWNWGIYGPLAQVSDRTAFLMQGDGAAEEQVNTDTSWQVQSDPGFEFIPRAANGLWAYWAADPGERIRAASGEWNRSVEESSASPAWLPAATAMREVISPRAGIAASTQHISLSPWGLVPDPLPQMEYRPVSAGRVVRSTLDCKSFPSGALSIPPHTTATILLDSRTMTTGYPRLSVSGGAKSQIKLAYGEALYDEHMRKGNRDDIGDRTPRGLEDEFLPDGAAHREFEPLWFRTWRYLEFTVITQTEPLILESLNVTFSAFPFVERATFQSSDPELAHIWDICWRTARLGAHETYMDTPFWEQLQYVDDTRTQALISYVVAGDDRLARQALHAFDESRVPEGLTQSRYPSRLPQFIPQFSLSYIDMLHDYWMYRADDILVKELLQGTRPILQWFSRHQLADGFVGSLPYWVMVDNVPDTKPFPRFGKDGRSAIVTLQFVQALQDASEMEAAVGSPSLANEYRKQAAGIAAVVYRTCWNAQLGLLADTPDKDSYSTHTNIVGVLTNAIPRPEQDGVMEKVVAAQGGQTLAGVGLARSSYRYQFYLSRAMDKTTTADKYLDTLVPWREMLKQGFTTTPEYAEPTRSDTHAWSAHPIYDLLTITAGIHPGSPGFASVRIEPHPGALEQFDATMPHPKGPIQITYHARVGHAEFSIQLPQHLGGSFVWKGKTFPLHEGQQSFSLPAGNQKK